VDGVWYNCGVENMPIAVVGMSCRFAGASNPGALWRNVMTQRAAFSRLDETTAPPAGATRLFNRPYPSVLGALGPVYACIPGRVTIPRQINCGENTDLYFAAQLAVDALEDACVRAPSGGVRGTVRLGYAPLLTPAVFNWFEHAYVLDQTMDILGRFFPNAPAESLSAVRGKLQDSLPNPNPASFASGLGHRVSDFVARECGFTGFASAVDAGALSAVVALQAAMDDLRAGRADVALCGAIMPPFTRTVLEGLSGNVLFNEGADFAPFDAQGRGTIPGEGGACFVLKRRADALAARDRIYALVSSVDSGACAPGDDLAAAAETAGVPVTSIGLVEADGRGEAEADAAEVAALRRLWGEHRPGGPLVGVGSVKGNTGHCFRAAAAAGLVKTALALHTRVLPPQVPCARPIEGLSEIASSVYLLAGARPWITGDATHPRRAAVLAADYTGRRGAIVLEEEPEGRE